MIRFSIRTGKPMLEFNVTSTINRMQWLMRIFGTVAILCIIAAITLFILNMGQRSFTVINLISPALLLVGAGILFTFTTDQINIFIRAAQSKIYKELQTSEVLVSFGLDNKVLESWASSATRFFKNNKRIGIPLNIENTDNLDGYIHTLKPVLFGRRDGMFIEIETITRKHVAPVKSEAKQTLPSFSFFKVKEETDTKSTDFDLTAGSSSFFM